SDLFLWNIKVSVAQFYTDNLSEEVKKGQKEKIAEGWLPTKPPLGYVSIGSQGKKIHVIDPITSPLVIKMFELYSTQNYSLKSLTAKVTKLGLRGRTGNRIPRSRIHQLLRDPFYMGKFRWKDQIYQGKHEPLITKELFDRVQTILSGKGTPLIRNIITCLKGFYPVENVEGLLPGKNIRDMFTDTATSIKTALKKAVFVKTE
ncbi:MAG: recombinase family protein, partial [Patescibacteria group bacterium]